MIHKDMCRQFILEQGLDLDYMIVAKTAIQFRQWYTNDDIQIHRNLDDLRDGLVVPIGSVEFVNDIRVKLINEPLFVENWPHDIRKWVLQSQYGECEFGSLPFYPIFVKPKYDNKLFSGELLSRESHTTALKGLVASNGKNLDDSTVVYWSEPIDFISEWRAILHDNRIVSFSPYDAEDIYKEYLYTKQADAFFFVRDILQNIDTSMARIVDIGYTKSGHFGIIECANHISTASTYTTMIDRNDYFNALCSVGFKIGV